MISNQQPILKIQNLNVSRGREFNLTVDDLELHEGEVLAIVGPNGAGKSTLLLALSKLLKPDSGTIFFRGQSIEKISDLSYRRQIALVLQDPLLLDTSVYNNIASGLRFRGVKKTDQTQLIEEWLDKFDISHLRDRPSSQLSGGQAQRVGLARAMVLQPDLLLLDEPFRALDTPTRTAFMQDLRKILSETGTTTIFITHNQEQALFIGDKVAVLLDGKISQIGSPQTVFSSPVDSTVAQFLGIENVLPGRVVNSKGGKMSINVKGIEMDAVGEVTAGKDVFFCLRPEDITLWKSPEIPPSSARNLLSGQVSSIAMNGPLLQITIDCGFPLVALITRASAEELEIEKGMEICVTFKASAVHLIPR